MLLPFPLLLLLLPGRAAAPRDVRIVFFFSM